MGVDDDKASEWLDISRILASDEQTGKVFVQSALELNRLNSKTGLSYESLIQDYNHKLTKLKDIKGKIRAKSDELYMSTYRNEASQKQAEQVLGSITASITTARDTFSRQKEELKSQLDEYLAQHQLSWQRIKLVEAAIDGGLKGKG